MLKNVRSKIEEAKLLLRTPTSENLIAATRTLEQIAVELSAVHRQVQSSDACPPELKSELNDFCNQFSSVRALLESSATFFNNLSGLRQSPSYERHGLLTTERYTGRTLARL